MASSGVELHHAPQDDQGLGTVREDVARGLTGGEGEVVPAGAAHLLGAVATVVRDERVVLRQHRPRLGHDAGRGVAAREQRVRVVPQAERHVVHGQLEDALGVRGEMGPEWRVRAAEEDGLVSQERARRVQRLPVSKARSRFLDLAGVPQQRHLHSSRAKHLGRLGERLPNEPQTLVVAGLRGPRDVRAAAATRRASPAASRPGPRRSGPSGSRRQRAGPGRGSRGPRRRCSSAPPPWTGARSASS